MKDNISIRFVCAFNSAEGFPAAMKEYENNRQRGSGMKMVYAFETLIYDVPLDENHHTNDTPKTHFVVIAAEQEGLKNLYHLISMVNTRDESVLDPAAAKNYRKGLLFAKRIVEREAESFKWKWEVRKEEISCGEPIAVLSNFTADELVKIQHLIGDVIPVSQLRGSRGKNWPVVESAAEQLCEDCYAKAHSIYGKDLPEPVQERLSKELGAITGNGFAVLYNIAQSIVRNAKSSSVLTSYKGGAGSSLAAYMAA